MKEVKLLSKEQANALYDRWVKGDKNLVLSERVFVMERILRKLIEEPEETEEGERP